MQRKKNDGIIEEISQMVTPDKKVIKKRKTKNQPAFNIQEHLINICATDVIQIYGIGISETGTDLSKWAGEEGYRGCRPMRLNLCPIEKISGGKLISKLLRKNRTAARPNLASQAFRMAANTLKTAIIGWGIILGE